MLFACCCCLLTDSPELATRNRSVSLSSSKRRRAATERDEPLQSSLFCVALPRLRLGVGCILFLRPWLYFRELWPLYHKHTLINLRWSPLYLGIKTLLLLYHYLKNFNLQQYIQIALLYRDFFVDICLFLRSFFERVNN